MMFFYAHSGLRYVVLLLGLLVIGYAAYGVVTRRPYDRTMRLLAAAFTGFIDLTALMGISYLFVGTFYPQLGGHIVSMILAIIVSHVVYGVMKRRPMSERTYMPHLVGTVVVLGLIATGIMAIGRPIVG